MPDLVTDLSAFLAAHVPRDAVVPWLTAARGVAFARRLPDPLAGSYETFCFKAADLLRRDGFDDALFQSLAERCPSQQAEVARLARAAGCAAPVLPAGSSSGDASSATGGTEPDPGPLPEPVVLSLTLGSTQVKAAWRLGGALQTVYAPLPSPSAALLADVVELRDNPGSAAVAVRIGEALRALLLRDGVGAQLLAASNAAVAAGAPLRLLLEIDADAGWTALPWELCRVSTPNPRFLATRPDVQLLRCLPQAGLVPRPDAPSPRRLLLLSACSAADKPISAHAEADDLAALWEEAGADVVVALEPTRDAIREILRTRGPFSVVHVACHGGPGRLTLGEPIPADHLGALFEGRVRDAVFVNACHGATLPPAPAPGTPGGALPSHPEHPGHAWRGVAGALASAGVPHTVALGAKLPDREARDMARAWHRAWLETGDPILATARARYDIRDSDWHTWGFLAHFSIGIGV